MKVGIAAIAKNEDNYIDEWIRYHLKLGIDQIMVFQNNWRHTSTAFDENIHVHWYVQDGNMQQLPAYNRALKEPELAIQQLDWCAFIDVDEFLCVRDQTRSLKEILADYSQFMSIAVNWRLFGSSGLTYDPSDNSVLKRFTKCGKDLNRHVKQIVNMKMLKDSGRLERAWFVNPHCGNWAAASLDRRAVIGPFNYNGLETPKPLELNHYAIKTYEECKLKVGRGRADTPFPRSSVDEFFKEHDINEVENTTAKDFYFGHTDTDSGQPT